MIPEWVQSDYMPGFVISVIVTFIFAFVVSKIGNIVVILILFALSISTLVDDSIGFIGKVWVFSGWAGALTYFLGLHYLVMRFFRGFKENMKSGPKPKEHSNRPRSNQRAQQRHDEEDEMRRRREAFERANEAFTARERQREQEEARRAERAREEFARAESAAYEEASRYAEEEARRQRAQQEQERQRRQQARDEEARRRQQRERESQQNQQRSAPKSESSNWWEVLGVPREADLTEIKKAHRNLVKKYHPDRVDALGEEFKELAEVKMKAINAAYQEAKKLKS